MTPSLWSSPSKNDNRQPEQMRGQQEPSLFTAAPIFHPMVSSKHNNSGRFISSASVIILVVFILLLRSSAGPFLNPKGEAKKSKSSVFFIITSFLYTWIISVTVVTLIPAFSTHYNGVIAASLFFPMTFSSIAVMLIGRFIIRTVFYFWIRCRVQVPTRKKQQHQKNHNAISEEKKKKTLKKRQRIKMVAFHRPFRGLAKNAIILSGLLCLLYAHCWSRTLSLFKAETQHGAGAVCRVVFTPFIQENENGASESSIWYIWFIAIFIMIISFAQDEMNGLHYQEEDGGHGCHGGHSHERRYSIHDNDEKEYGKDAPSDLMTKTSKGGMSVWTNYLSETKREGPKNTLDMVPWLSLFAASCTVDIFLQLMVFSGRVDGRAMQSALQKNQYSANSFSNSSNKENNEETDEDKFCNLQRRYEGCVFDYTSEYKRDADGGFWFDFMADCGDGFNPSYQVARMLAQPTLTMVHNNKQRKFPRGQLLINGGDLAYPNPSEFNYEKRFFRTFEDAMQPPPKSFRRSKISTKKPGLPVREWNNCFYKSLESSGCSESADSIHKLYKGPSSFVLPGNHDWYDGLASYTRFILCRDWLGGWLLPQRRSYFALKLQQGWWVLAMDCALSSDIDIEQYKFFADVADNAIGPEDAVIIINHEPHWVTDFDDGKVDEDRSEQNIRELMYSHLKGKVRLRVAGDLHHYTRHIPVRRSINHPTKRKSRSRSFSFDETKKNNPESKLEPFTEENKPELIVSGGGGAFLHGTHLYSKNIKFGKLHYKRVCAFPSEKVSQLIGCMNLWHFRSRNYRTDWLMALIYFGLVSSLLPLCGLYADYEAFNPEHKVYQLVLWTLKKIGSLIWRILTSENVSLLWSCVVLTGAIGIQAVDKKIHPFLRFMCGCFHALAHIIAALLCLLFVSCVTEWVVQDRIVQISPTNEHYNATNLASSLYENYKTHFFPILENYTHPDSSLLAHYYAESQHEEEGTLLFNIIKTILEFLLRSWKWIYTTLPLLKTTLSIFDLPGLITHYHQELCTNLCANGLECLLTHDKYRFLTIERTSYLKYMVSICLYFLCVAIPFAGGIFGTWLTISSNLLNSQANLSFSALMWEHYKNFLKLHIKDNGDLEVFAIGLKKIPTQWVEDRNWDGHQVKRHENSSKPSWSLQSPSRWIPLKETISNQPHIVDYTCITKRQIATS